MMIEFYYHWLVKKGYESFLKDYWMNQSFYQMVELGHYQNITKKILILKL